MGGYTKAIVAVIMMLALVLNNLFDIGWHVNEAQLTDWINTGIVILTPVFVWLFPNKRKV